MEIASFIPYKLRWKIERLVAWLNKFRQILAGSKYDYWSFYALRNWLFSQRLDALYWNAIYHNDLLPTVGIGAERHTHLDFT